MKTLVYNFHKLRKTVESTQIFLDLAKYFNILKNTFFDFIPKTFNPITFYNIQSIALGKFLDKIICKTLTNRLKVLFQGTLQH